ncbi:hypothetical protein SAVIM338S_05015 [Streptomyces avidinii]
MEQGRSNLQISDHATVEKAVVIERAAHVSLVGGELKQRRRPFQAPRDIPEFVGREDILSRMSDALGEGGDSPTIWVLSGMAGVGKTSVAVRAANKFAGSFTDGILYASLAGANPNPTEPADVLVRFLRDLGVAAVDIPGDYESLVTAYRTLIANKRILVVLDDACDTRQVNDLIPTASASAAVITSRRPLGTLPGSQNIKLDVWTHDECARFFNVVLGVARVEGNLAEINELADLCGRLPIALRVIAAQLNSRPLWPVSRVADRLRDEQRRLALLRADDIEVRSVFSTAYESLNGGQASIFRALCMTPGLTFSVESVAKLADIDEYEAEDLLEDLSDRHLVNLDEAPGRYKMHDLMRLFAKGKSDQEDGFQFQEEATLRLLKWHLEVLQAKGPSIRAWVRAERASLVAGVVIAGQKGWDELCWTTANVLASYHSSDSDYRDWITCNQAGLAAARRGGSRHDEAVMLGGLGQASRRLSKFSEAQSFLEDSLSIFREMEHGMHCAQILWEIGEAASSQWDVARAMSSLLESVAISHDYSNLAGVTRGLHALGHLNSAIGRHGEALECFEKELELAMNYNGSDKRRGIAYQGMASCLARSSSPESAIGPYEQSIALARVIEDRRALRIRLFRAALVLEKVGRIGEAASYCEEALRIAREDSDTVGIAWNLHHMAKTLERRGDIEASDALYAEILALPDVTDKPVVVIATLHALADSYVRRGDAERGESLLASANSMARNHDSDEELVEITLCQSALQVRIGNLSEGLKYAEQAVTAARSYGSAKLLARCLSNVGKLQEKNGSVEDAARIYEEKLRLEILMQQREKASETAKTLVRVWAELGVKDKVDLYSDRLVELSQSLKNS